MTVVKNKTTEENRKFWEFVEKTAAEVRKLPRWMGGDAPDNEASGTKERGESGGGK